MTPYQTEHSRCHWPLALLLLLATSAGANDYYRWQDEGGHTHYGDTPPPQASALQRIAPPLQSPLYQVEAVIDGDTIMLQHLGKIRLLGLNTPEVAHRDQAAQPFGDRARARLQQLLNGKKVYLEFDQQRRDRFQRLLAHVILEDGTSINELLLREGLARALFLQPNLRHLQRYYQIEAEGQAAKRGIWSLPEYQPRPAARAADCVKRFCQLYGRVLAVESKTRYIYLHLPGQLQVAIDQHHLSQFHATALDIEQLKGENISVRGWIGSRGGKPYLKLEHPLQIKLADP